MIGNEVLCSTFPDVYYECSRNGRGVNPLSRKILNLETGMRRRLEELNCVKTNSTLG